MEQNYLNYLFINYLFQEFNFKKIVLDTKLENKRAQYVYEIIGFIKTKEDEKAIYYELLKEEQKIKTSPTALNKR